MAEDPLRTAFEAIHAKFQDELNALRGALEAQQTQAVADARREAEAAAEAQWAARLDAVRAEMAAAAARAREEHDRALAAERQQVEAARLETRQQAETTGRAEHERAREIEAARTEAAAVRKELDAARAELEPLRGELDAARQRTFAVEHAREQLQATMIADRDQALQKANVLYERDTAAAVTEARAQERQAQLAIVEKLLDGVKALDSARTLSETLTALVTVVRSNAPRAAVFILDGDQLQPWKVADFGDLGAQPVSAGDEGLLARAVRNGEPVSTAVTSAPAFASLAAGRAALAVPIVVGSQAVAVLYADDGEAQRAEAPASWPEAVQVLGRHASTCLAHLTAVRTMQAARFAAAPKTPAAAASAPPRPQPAAPALSDEESSARRYARLLVSEIKLYNESAVRVGRERRDLLTRLGAEIERAQRLYEERVPSSIGARSQYFHQELVQTLADGDPGLLGSSASHR